MKSTALGKSFEREKLIFTNQKKNYLCETIYSKDFSEKNVINERKGREPACKSSCETYQQKGLKFREE